jgi:hypothetical protein
MRSSVVGLLLLVASLPATATDDNEAEKVQVMRNEVLKELFAAEGKSDAVAGAY